MADWTNIARPYAKAIFEHARDKQALSTWSTWLTCLCDVVSSETMLDFIDNPETTAEQHVEAVRDVLLSFSVFDKADTDVLQALIDVLAKNKRLPVLPSIFQQFEVLRAEEEHRVSVHVTSFSPLSEIQQQQLVLRLGKRLNRTVTLELSVDPALLGGAVICAKDWVVDASISGQLGKLRADLVAL